MIEGERGISPVFAYTLTLGITALLIVGLVTSATGYVDGQREAVTENELEVIGQQLSAEIAAVDRMSRTEGAVVANSSRDLPPRVSGSTYTVSVKKDSNGPTDPYLELTVNDPDVTVQVGVAIQAGLAETSTGGGPVIVSYDGSQVVVQNE